MILLSVRNPGHGLMGVDLPCLDFASQMAAPLAH